MNKGSKGVIMRTRSSNIELFRIIAMFLVLVVHADFFSLGAPTQVEMHTNPIGSYTRFFWQALSIGCVDMFVLISGWFGIRPKVKSFANFIFQCLFFLIGIYVFILLAGLTELSVKGIAGCFFLLKWNWFIKAYIGLYILSPVLNAFMEHSTEKQVRFFLVAFFSFQTIYGWVNGAAPFFEGGYSTMSFIGLYMLARYSNVYRPKCLYMSRNVYLVGYSGIVVFLAIVSGLSTQVGHPLGGWLFSYINPLVIIASLCLLLYFSKLTFSNHFVNKIAASSFAVFLLHTNPNLCRQYFVPVINGIYDKTGGVICLFSICLFLLVIFVIAILIDQVRLFFWDKLLLAINKVRSSKFRKD